MNQTKSTSVKNDFGKELTGQFSKLLNTIRRNGKNALKAVAKQTPNSSSLIETHLQSIGLIEHKIDQLLQLQLLERDEFSFMRERINVCDALLELSTELQNKFEQNKTVIETKLPQDKPFVHLNKSLFRRWMLWCIDSLYREPAVIHILIDVAYEKSNVLMRISPKRLASDFELSLQAIDNLFAERYFQLENRFSHST